MIKASQSLSAMLNVEVPACSDHKDSRKESSSLIKVKNSIKDLFSDSEYKECYKIEFTSYAAFSLPVNTLTEGELEGDALGLYRNDEVNLGFYLPGSMAEKLTALESKNHQKLKLKVIVKFMALWDLP